MKVQWTEQGKTLECMFETSSENSRIMWFFDNFVSGECVRWKCDFYLNLDSVARLDNRDTLRLLVEQNRPVVAPMLFGTRKGQRNFHGLDTTSLHCPDSIEVVKNPDRGLLSVGVVTSCYLIRGDVILDPKTKPSYVLPDDVPLDINSDILFSDSMSGHDIDLFASNRYDFGHLLLWKLTTRKWTSVLKAILVLTNMTVSIKNNWSYYR